MSGNMYKTGITWLMSLCYITVLRLQDKDQFQEMKQWLA